MHPAIEFFLLPIRFNFFRPFHVIAELTTYEFSLMMTVWLIDIIIISRFRSFPSIRNWVHFSVACISTWKLFEYFLKLSKCLVLVSYAPIPVQFGCFGITIVKLNGIRIQFQYGMLMCVYSCVCKFHLSG